MCFMVCFPCRDVNNMFHGVNSDPDISYYTVMKMKNCSV
ncbi:hypothetical protein SXCC_03564 [Gluconacetobacter sp. SXCC-1]|nr:hypothetical protein SXCC_03564 [Gluconacetobacter sp. SXCC-1]